MEESENKLDICRSDEGDTPLLKRTSTTPLRDRSLRRGTSSSQKLLAGALSCNYFFMTGNNKSSHLGEVTEVGGSHRRVERFVGRRSSSVNVPRYILYGEDASNTRGDWILNLEPLAERCRARNWRIEPHSHPKFAQLVFVAAGGGVMTVEGENEGFAAPALLIVPTCTIHGFVYEVETTGWVLTVLNQHLSEVVARAGELAPVFARPAVLSCKPSDWHITEIANAMTRLNYELDAGAMGGVVAAEACLLSVLVAALRAMTERKNMYCAGQVPGGPAAIVARFREIIEDHYHDGLTVSGYAEKLAISVSQLRAACLEVCGELPLHIVHERVLIEAKRALAYSSDSVAQVAYKLGFTDPAYFTRFFCKANGASPTKFRANRNGDRHIR